PKGFPAYVDVHRLFTRREPIELCKEALAKGPMTTRQLALYVMQRKGLDLGDKVLAKSIGLRLIHALRKGCTTGGSLQAVNARFYRWVLGESAACGVCAI